MKWFKHDTDANMDAKLQEVLLDYGLEGYGLYWYCVELIAGKVSCENLNFELEHDARIIARNVGSTVQKVTEMMTYFSNLGLFENNGGTITCLKLARRLDQSMTSNPAMRRLISQLKNHDGVMTESDNVMQDKIRLDHNRKDNKPLVEEKPQPEEKGSKKYNYDDQDMRLAEWIFAGVKTVVNSAKEPNFKSWANEIRLMRERDKRTRNEIAALFQWANNDSFWKANILSPKKLRDKWTQLEARRGTNETNINNGSSSKPSQNATTRVSEALAKQRAEFNGSSEAMGNNDGVLHGQVHQEERGGAFIDLDNGDWSSK